MELPTIRFRDFLYFLARMFFWVVVGVFLWWFLAEGAFEIFAWVRSQVTLPRDCERGRGM